MKRSRTRRARPALEWLEGRQLLDGGGLIVDSTPGAGGITLELPTSEVQPIRAPSEVEVPAEAPPVVLSPELQAAAAVTIADIQATQAQDPDDEPDPVPVTQLNYVTPEGSRVVVRLRGAGTLEGSVVRPDGALELVYDGTNQNSQLIAFAHGPARPRLASIRDADVPFDNSVGIGANLIGLVGLPQFELIDGGRINLIGGVRKLFLHSVGRDTQLVLRDLPVEDVPPPPGQEFVLTEGRFLDIEIALIDGLFFPFEIGPTEDPADVDLAELPPPPGIRIQIRQINADPIDSVGNAQIFGYDPEAGMLVRFDGTTGDVLQQIPAPSLGADSAGVSLGRIRDDQLVVLVGQNDTVRAFDALTGGFVGQFTTNNLPVLPASNLQAFDRIAGMGTSAAATFELVDGEPEIDPFGAATMVVAIPDGGPGQAQLIDVGRSLEAGVAVQALRPNGELSAPFVPGRDLNFIGGATGVPGLTILDATASAFFDSFQPMTQLEGVIRVNSSRTQLTEFSRVQLPGGRPVTTIPQLEAMGSIDTLVARVIDVTDGVNRVNLLNPINLTRVDTIDLNYPNRLAGLSESFRPAVAGSALFDIQGSVQALLVNEARGLVVNNLGVLHLLAINRASDSVVFGFPINHVLINQRSNVHLFSSPRLFGTRGGVVVDPTLRPFGPIFLP